jgi:hypothetical protein
MEELASDPNYQARKAAGDAERAARTEALREAERPIVEDLARAGINVVSVWNLYKVDPAQREHAVPVLLRHLALDYPDRVLEGVGQGLADKAARPWWAELRSLYLQDQRAVVRDRLAGALAACAKREHYDDLLALIGREDLGDSRIYFLRPINRIGNRMAPGKGRSVVESVAADPRLGREAAAILKGQGPNEG